MRRTLPLLSAAALLIGLTACSSAPDGGATASPTAPAETAIDVCATPGGDAVDAVEVSTDLDEAPTADFDKGLSTDETQRKVVVEGDGDELPAGGTATVAYSVWDAATGTQVDAYGYKDDESVNFTASAESVLAGIAKTIGCVTEGSRMVSVVPSDDGFGPDGYAELGVNAGDSLIFVVDVLSILPTRATGEDQDPQDGFPEVALADDGTPTVTIPDSLEAPDDLQVEVLKKGDGDKVGEGDSVTLQYQGVNFDTGEVFDQSWGAGPTTFATDQVVEGFGSALIGQTVGSQVVAVIPPALAYGTGTPSDSQPLAGQTLVFVIDILSTSPAAG